MDHLSTIEGGDSSGSTGCRGHRAKGGRREGDHGEEEKSARDLHGWLERE